MTQDSFLHYKGELAIAISKGSKDISRDKALSHISGYFAANDLSSRDWQRDPHKGESRERIPAYDAELDVVLVPLLAPLAVVSSGCRDHIRRHDHERVYGDVQVFGRVLELVLDGDPALALVAIRPGDRVRLLVPVLEDGLEHDLVGLGGLVARSVDQVPVPVLGQAHREAPVLVYGLNPLGELVRPEVLVHAPVVVYLHIMDPSFNSNMPAFPLMFVNMSMHRDVVSPGLHIVIVFLPFLEHLLRYVY
ncbi:FAA-hydrolase domain-containing protein [Fusarium sp. LHS14.1]|nr:FAA-hydrolase domain-containing protein [Fusarium sp. LHS14.1]